MTSSVTDVITPGSTIRRVDPTDKTHNMEDHYFKRSSNSDKNSSRPTDNKECYMPAACIGLSYLITLSIKSYTN